VNFLQGSDTTTSQSQNYVEVVEGHDLVFAVLFENIAAV